MRTLQRFLFISVLLSLCVPAAFSQNALLDNPKHRESIDLKRQAERAFDDGDFERATELAARAEALSKTARAEAETERLRFLSFNRMRAADRRVEFCAKEDAAVRYPELWPSALEALALAKGSFDAKEYEKSIEASRRVIDILAPVMPKDRSRTAAAAVQPPAPPVPPPPPVQSPPAAPILPAYYEVRLLEPLRDCLWRIAAYPFVYGDPLKWPVLYEANRARLVDPENPHLIHPGLELTIPSISGERREGVWKE